MWRLAAVYVLLWCVVLWWVLLGCVLLWCDVVLCYAVLYGRRNLTKNPSLKLSGKKGSLIWVKLPMWVWGLGFFGGLGAQTLGFGV